MLALRRASVAIHHLTHQVGRNRRCVLDNLVRNLDGPRQHLVWRRQGFRKKGVQQWVRGRICAASRREMERFRHPGTLSDQAAEQQRCLHLPDQPRQKVRRARLHHQPPTRKHKANLRALPRNPNAHRQRHRNPNAHSTTLQRPNDRLPAPLHR